MKFVALVLVAVSPFVLGPTRSSASVEITPVFETPRAECPSITVTDANLVGFVSLPFDEHTVRARVLYREGTSRGEIVLRLMRDDADALQREMNALLQKQRSKPIFFDGYSDRDGNCIVAQVSG